MKKICILLAIALVTQTGQALAQGENFESVLRNVENLQAAGRTNRAVQFLKDSEPKHLNKEYTVKLLTCLINAGEYDQAVSSAKKWLPDSQNDFKSLLYTFIGTAYNLKKEYQAALDAFTKAIESNKNPSAEIAKQKIQLLLAGKKEEDLTKTINSVNGKTAPDDGTTLQLHLELAQLQCAAGLVAVEFDCPPKNLTKDGYKLESAGNFKSATNIYLEAVKKEPSNMKLANALGLCAMTEALSENEESGGYTKEDYFKIADDAFRKAYKISENDWQTWNNWGILKTCRDDYLGAKSALAIALEDKNLPVEQKIRIEHALRFNAIAERLRNRFNPPSSE
ncbi:MAG: hypothetical protein IAF58_17995 [Leptolyngbya sp.]|nr:hypothetical protein [Candidatus Melainabacteria bacterium]